MLLRGAEQAMVRAKTAVLKPIGLTLAQFVALGELERRPGITAATLARACLVTPQAMMVLLKTMDEQGLVSRSPNERHPNVLELNMTSAGREALYSARKAVDPVERRAIAAFSATELERLRALLLRVCKAFDTS
jgi:DNA-binding MarR family transcriptional regulator